MKTMGYSVKMIAFAAKVTRGDTKAYVKYAFPSKRKVPWFYIIIVGGFSIFSWFFIINEDSLIKSLRLLLNSAILVLISLLIVDGLHRLGSFMISMVTNQEKMYEHIFEVYADSIVTVTEHNRHKVSISAIDDFAETEKHFFIIGNTRTILPKREMTEDELQAVYVLKDNFLAHQVQS